MYLCIIYPAFVASWFPRSVYTLKYSIYFSILTCSHAWFTTALDGTARTLDLLIACREDYRQRQVGESWMRRHMEIDSAYWDSEAVAARQCTCVILNQKQLMSLLYYACWRSYWHRGDTELTTKCLHACYLWMWSRTLGVQINNAETSLALVLLHVAIVTI